MWLEKLSSLFRLSVLPNGLNSAESSSRPPGQFNSESVRETFLDLELQSIDLRLIIDGSQYTIGQCY